MGNAEAKKREEEQLEREIVDRLKDNVETVVPGADTNLGKEVLDRLKIGVNILRDPTPVGAIKGAVKAVTVQGRNYVDLIKNNKQLKNERRILERLVDEKRKRKAEKTGMSYDDVKRAGKELGKRKLKWDKNDTLQLLYGGPWGLIGSAVRHKRQNDIYDLEDEYKQLQSEGYGFKKRLIKGSKEAKEYMAKLRSMRGRGRLNKPLLWAGIYPPGDPRWQMLHGEPGSFLANKMKKRDIPIDPPFLKI